MAQTYRPPDSVAAQARKALRWRDEHPNEIQGGTQVGWTRANQLAKQQNISLDTIKRMGSFFARHQKNSAIDPRFKGTPWRDAGYVAWLIWGGDPGKSWVSGILKSVDKESFMPVIDQKRPTKKLLLVKEQEYPPGRIGKIKIFVPFPMESVNNRTWETDSVITSLQKTNDYLASHTILRYYSHPVDGDPVLLNMQNPAVELYGRYEWSESGFTGQAYVIDSDDGRNILERLSRGEQVDVSVISYLNCEDNYEGTGECSVMPGALIAWDVLRPTEEPGIPGSKVISKECNGCRSSQPKCRECRKGKIEMTKQQTPPAKKQEKSRSSQSRGQVVKRQKLKTRQQEGVDPQLVATMLNALGDQIMAMPQDGADQLTPMPEEGDMPDDTAAEEGDMPDDTAAEEGDMPDELNTEEDIAVDMKDPVDVLDAISTLADDAGTMMDTDEEEVDPLTPEMNDPVLERKLFKKPGATKKPRQSPKGKEDKLARALNTLVQQRINSHPLIRAATQQAEQQAAKKKVFEKLGQVKIAADIPVVDQEKIRQRVASEYSDFRLAKQAYELAIQQHQLKAARESLSIPSAPINYGRSSMPFNQLTPGEDSESKTFREFCDRNIDLIIAHGGKGRYRNSGESIKRALSNEAGQRNLRLVAEEMDTVYGLPAYNKLLALSRPDHRVTPQMATESKRSIEARGTGFSYQNNPYLSKLCKEAVSRPDLAPYGAVSRLIMIVNYFFRAGRFLYTQDITPLMSSSSYYSLAATTPNAHILRMYTQARNSPTTGDISSYTTTGLIPGREATFTETPQDYAAFFRSLYLTMDNAEKFYRTMAPFGVDLATTVAMILTENMLDEDDLLAQVNMTNQALAHQSIPKVNETVQNTASHFFVAPVVGQTVFGGVSYGSNVRAAIWMRRNNLPAAPSPIFGPIVQPWQTIGNFTNYPIVINYPISTQIGATVLNFGQLDLIDRSIKKINASQPDPASAPYVAFDYARGIALFNDPAVALGAGLAAEIAAGNVRFNSYNYATNFSRFAGYNPSLSLSANADNLVTFLLRVYSNQKTLNPGGRRGNIFWGAVNAIETILASSLTSATYAGQLEIFRTNPEWLAASGMTPQEAGDVITTWFRNGSVGCGSGDSPYYNFSPLIGFFNNKDHVLYYPYPPMLTGGIQGYVLQNGNIVNNSTETWRQDRVAFDNTVVPRSATGEALNTDFTVIYTDNPYNGIVKGV